MADVHAEAGWVKNSPGKMVSMWHLAAGGWTPADRKVAGGDDGSGAERRGTVTLLSEVATTPVSRVTSDTRLRYRIMQD